MQAEQKRNYAMDNGYLPEYHFSCLFFLFHVQCRFAWMPSKFDQKKGQGYVASKVKLIFRQPIAVHSERIVRGCRCFVIIQEKQHSFAFRQDKHFCASAAGNFFFDFTRRPHTSLLLASHAHMLCNMWRKIFCRRLAYLGIILILALSKFVCFTNDLHAFDFAGSLSVIFVLLKCYDYDYA